MRGASVHVHHQQQQLMEPVKHRRTGTRSMILLLRRIAVGAVFITVAVVNRAWLLDNTRAIPVETTAELQEPAKMRCESADHRDPMFAKGAKACLSRIEMLEIITGIIITASRAFGAHNITYWLESGTLLGSYREKGFIAYDRDADLGIDQAGLKYLQSNQVQVPEEYHITVWNSSWDRRSYRDDKLPVRVVHKATALYTDVFAFLDSTNTTTGEQFVGPLPSECFSGCARCPRVGKDKHFSVPREWVFPVVDCPFEGRTFKCPRETAKYLDYLFGGDFLQPDGH